MKKNYFLLSLIILFVANYSFGQRIAAFTPDFGPIKFITNSPSAKADFAQGDTLFYLYFSEYTINPTDAAAFADSAQDLDGLTPDPILAANGYTSNWQIWGTVVPPDTLLYLSIVSWFSPVGQADDWYSFGPITIPTAGATLSWYHSYPDTTFRDGYEVRLSTTGLGSGNFTTPAIYTVMDNQASTANEGGMFTLQSVNIDAATYGGQQVYFAFHHNANDMFILNLDDILITEGETAGIEEESVNGIKLFQNQPNPFNNTSLINYEITNSSNVSLEVTDITGRKLMMLSEGKKERGVHSISLDASALSKGVYFYTLKANGVSLTKHMIITE